MPKSVWVKKGSSQSSSSALSGFESAVSGVAKAGEGPLISGSSGRSYQRSSQSEDIRKYLKKRGGSHGSSVGSSAESSAFSTDSKRPARKRKSKGRSRSEHSGFSYSEVKGDLFGCSENSSLVHCVSRDMHMGKGIATLFKSNFGRVSELKAQRKQVGEAAILDITPYVKEDSTSTSVSCSNPRFVYYLVTKERYFHKPKYEHLQSTLDDCRRHATVNNVRRIAMPKIGCGLDRLRWDRVSRMIRNTFEHTNIAVTVYYLE